MNRYTKVNVNVSEGQKDKISRAAAAGTGVSIKLSHGDLTGEDVIALTQAQINRMYKAYQSGTGLVIKMSKTQLAYNAKVEGGFIAALLPMLATAGKFLATNIIPKLAQGALAGIGSAAASKVVDKISGKGVLYVRKNGMGCTVTPAGAGLYLTPWQKGGSTDGLFMKTNSGKYNRVGEGLLLGENSPFKNIPILGMLL